MKFVYKRRQLLRLSFSPGIFVCLNGCFGPCLLFFPPGIWLIPSFRPIDEPANIWIETTCRNRPDSPPAALVLGVHMRLSQRTRGNAGNVVKRRGQCLNCITSLHYSARDIQKKQADLRFQTMEHRASTQPGIVRSCAISIQVSLLATERGPVVLRNCCWCTCVSFMFHV